MAALFFVAGGWTQPAPGSESLRDAPPPRAAVSWRDDFNTLDPATWNVISRDCIEPRNVSVANGMLRIATLPSSRTDCPGVTVGRVNTYGLKTFQPGTFSARMRYVVEPGSWQNFWLTGANGRPFPANGEVDIAEVIGPTPNNTHVALHSAFKSGASGRCDMEAGPAATVDRVWHVYSVTTGATAVTFKVDGATIARFTPTSSNCTWPYGDPMRILFDSSVGKYGGTLDLSKYPIAFKVDWVTWTPS
jgi:beta-glucanase (GH16 family)